MGAGLRAPAFVGRAREREVLRALLADARAGRLRSALVEGEAGIGKSRLIAEILPDAADLGYDLVTAACEEYENARAFAPLSRAFTVTTSSTDERRVAIARMLEDRWADVDATHFRLVDGFVDLVEAVALERPLVVVVEDLHWADPATVAVLRSVGKRLPFTPLAVLCSSRPMPRAPGYAALIADLVEPNGDVVPLSPLDDADVARFVADTLGSEPGPDVLTLAARAGGNPLFLGELLGALEHDERASVPEGVRATILRRIAYLSVEALDFLRAASILGSTFSPRDVATILGVPVTSFVTAIDEVVGARVLEAHGDALRFRHDLIREALYLDRPEPVRRALHVEAARALQAAGAPVAQVAEQYALGAEPGDDAAIATIIDAALTVERSPATRIELLERALALTSDADPGRDEIRAHLAEAMVPGGRPEDAERVATELADRPALAQRMRTVIAQALRLGGRNVELVERIDWWLAGSDVDEREHVALLALSAFARGQSVAFDPRETVELAREALRRADAMGDDELIVSACMAHVPSGSRAHIRGLFPLVERATRLVEARPQDDLLQHHAHYSLGRIYLSGHMGDIEPSLARAEEAFRLGMRLAEDAGRVADVPMYLDGLAYRYYYEDRWDEALAEAEASIAAAEEVGTRMMQFGTTSIVAHISILRGDRARAEAAVRSEERLAQELGPQFEETFRAHRAMMCEADGDLEGALEHRWALFSRNSEENAEQWWLTFWFALCTRDDEKVAFILDWLASRPEAWAPYARLARAMVPKDGDAVRAALDELTVNGWTHTLHERAMFAFTYSGRADEALEHFRKAAEHYERTGSYAWYDQRAQQLRRLGVRVPPRRQSRPERGWGALTDAEQRVARLAAEGLTNPQIGERLFVSRRTVQTHLQHVFQKLGIASRVELAAEVARRGA